MKILAKKFYILSDEQEITLGIIRKKLLSWILLLLNILVLPIVIIGVIEAIKFEQNYAAIAYIAFFIILLSNYLFRNKSPYWLSVSLFLLSGYAMALLNITLYGFSGAGIPILYALAVLATIFLGVHAGFIMLLIGSVSMAVVAYLMTNHLLVINIDLMKISTLPISWITATMVLLFLGSVMIFGYEVIQNNLLYSLLRVKQQAASLKKNNQELEEALSFREEILQKLHTAKKKAEESDQLKTEFINNLSHEIRTPMNAILGFSNLLNKPILTDEKRKKYIDTIQINGTQLMRIVDDLLDMSILATKQAEVIEEQICLNNLLSNLFFVWEKKAIKKNIQFYLQKELTLNESKIHIDSVILNKILTKLLENALKFTTEGSIELGCCLTNASLEIYVKDTGIGIKPESLKTIFDRFSQEEKSLNQNVGGLGLGLSIAKENAKLLNGEITVLSEKGKGSTFKLIIPHKPLSLQTT